MPLMNETLRAVVRPVHALLVALAAMLLLATANATASDIELYDRADFRGARLGLDAPTANLASHDMGNRVSSLIVNRGSWELCAQPLFRGACVTLGPGRYARLPPGLDERLQSLRPVRDEVSRPRPLPPGQVGIMLYGQLFPGQELRVSGAERNLADRGFNDSATHIDVLGGTWELCSDGGFSGQCQRFGPGRHALPPELRDRLSSLRPTGPDVAGPPPTPDGGRPWPRQDRDGHRPWQGAAPAIVFHESPDGSGRQLPLVAAAPNFAQLDFNDRASSVEVFRGRWQVCRHADFGGNCVVLGPGRYALGSGLNDAVSSARPLSDRGDQPLAASGAVTLHDHADFRGRSLLVDAPVANLRDLGFNDRALAIEVHGGRWELCNAAGYRGRCLEFGAGWYRLPPGLAGELSSLRPR